MKKYKALILDLDGTTIPNRIDALPNPRIIKSINSIRDLVYVSIATGRPLSLALPVINCLKLSGLCILVNGIHLFDPVRNTIIREISIDCKEAENAARIIRKYSENVGYFDGIRNNQYSFTKNPKKILSVFAPDIIASEAHKLETELSLMHGIAVHSMVSWKANCIWVDVTNSQATKLHGIHEIMKIEHISKDEIIGVGDSYNDYPLLMAAGLKIAMGNAVPELKAIADYIAPDVNDDGVATIIEKFFY